MEENPIPQQPQEFSLGNIALSLSGGGYRAAAFHLGVLDFLHQVGLLEQVTMLSTVSGGSITGAKYVFCLSQQPTKSQPEFHRNFYDSLHTFVQTQRLPESWLTRLKQPNIAKNQTFRSLPPSVSLIRAAASIYAISPTDGGLLGQMRLGDFRKMQSQCHLKEIVFNTTELQTGLNFRFRIGDGGRVGNGTFRLPQDIADEVALADVVAASSCFPGGFEPLLFPQDFQWPKEKMDEIVQQIRSKVLHDDFTNPKQEKTLPLVDGGIYDNLGIESLLLADSRLQNRANSETDPVQRQAIIQQQIGTLIVSDTDNIGLDNASLNQRGERTPLFTVPDRAIRNIFTRLKLSQFAQLLSILFAVMLVSTLGALVGTAYEMWVVKNWVFSLFGGWVTLVLSGVTILLGWLTDVLRTLSSNRLIQLKDEAIASPLDLLRNIISDWNLFLENIGKLKLGDVVDLVTVRFLSFPSLFLAFLSNQRRQSHKLIYSSALYQGRVISCFMFDIPRQLRVIQNRIRTQENSNVPDFIENVQALEVMASIGDAATRTPTTLWFESDKPDQLDTLIACGQFTMCFNLLEHLHRKIRDGQSKLSLETQKTYSLCLVAWKQFEKNPQCWVGDNRLQALLDWEQYRESAQQP
jgi:predicted acylesterase/phospholipase RssA